MGSKITVFICIQFAIFNVVYPQCLNRVLPNYGSNILPIAESLLPNLVGNQLNYLPYDLPYELLPNVLPSAIQPNVLQSLPNVLQQQPNILQSLPNVLQPRLPNVLQPGLPGCAAPTTIIQDSSVANNLANALQLLVVSNLLSNTLPLAADRVIPGYPQVEFVSAAPRGYNYLY